MELNGTITINKRLARHPVWERKDYGYCWLDLLLLANDQARSVPIGNGEFVDVQRGQVAWSLRALEKRWDKSGEWIAAFLTFCKNHDMVKVDSNRRRTIITVINYETYNPQKPVTETGTETATEPVTEPEQKGEEGKGRGKREEPPAWRNYPDVPTAIAYFRQQGADYSEEEIRSGWLKLTAEAVDGYWMCGRPPRRAADWRVLLESELATRRTIYGSKKNSARAAQERTEGEPPKPVTGFKLTFDHMKKVSHD